MRWHRTRQASQHSRRGPRRRHAATTASVCLVLAVASPLAGSHGAPPERAAVWGPVIAVTADGVVASGGGIAVDPAGWTVAVWADAGDNGIWVTTAPPGEPWTSFEWIGTGTDPRVGIDGTGTATVVWSSLDGTERILSARHPRRGEWTEAVPISDPVPAVPADCRLDTASTRLAVSSGGAAVVSWEWKKCHPRILQAAYSTAQGSWTSPQDIAGRAQDTSLAINRDGTAIVTYLRLGGVGTDRARVFVSRRPARGNWSVPRGFGVTTECCHADPHVAMNARGTAVLVYVRGKDQIMTVRRAATGAWGRPQQVSRKGSSGRGPVVAMDSSGTATVAWEAGVGQGWRIVSTRCPVRGSCTRPVQVDPFYPGESFVGLTMAANGGGDVLLGWNRCSADAGERILAAFRPRGGHWGAPKHLSRSERGAPEVGIARSGDAVVLWTYFGTVKARFRTR